MPEDRETDARVTGHLKMQMGDLFITIAQLRADRDRLAEELEKAQSELAALHGKMKREDRK